MDRMPPGAPCQCLTLQVALPRPPRVLQRLRQQLPIDVTLDLDDDDPARLVESEDVGDAPVRKVRLTRHAKQRPAEHLLEVVPQQVFNLALVQPVARRVLRERHQALALLFDAEQCHLTAPPGSPGAGGRRRSSSSPG